MDNEIGQSRHKHMYKPCAICGATIAVHFHEKGRALVTHAERRLAEGPYSEMAALIDRYDDLAHEIAL